MLHRTLEWFRIVNANPDPAHLEKCSKSVEAFYAKLIAAPTNNDAAEVVAILINGPIAQTPVVDAIIGDIRANQSVFPADWNESKTEIQAFAGLTMETMLRAKGDSFYRKQIGAASVLQNGLALWKSKDQPQFDKEIEHVRGHAESILSRYSRSQHARLNSMPEILKTPLKSDAEVNVALIEALRGSFQEAVGQLQAQARLDQEELNILWWLYAGYSDTAGRKFSEMDVWAAAYSAGVEVATLSLAPPIDGLLEIVTRAVESERKAGELKPGKLTKIVPSWKDAVNLEVMTTGSEAAVIKAFPTLFPICWLAIKLEEIGPDADWKTPFTTATRISLEVEISPRQLAQQIFRERTGARFFPA